MGVLFQSGYTLPSGDQPLTHARIAHSGNWITGTASSNSTAPGFFVDAPNDSLTYEFWQPATATAFWILTPPSDETIDYCCIAAHNLGSSGATLQVQFQMSPTTWGVLTNVTAITDDSPIFVIFQPITAPAFRIRVAGPVRPRIGVVRFGQALQMPQPLYAGHTPLILSRQTTMRSNKSTTGEFLGRTRLRNARSTQITWEHLRADWVRQNWIPFQFAMEEDPFFLAWRPIRFPNDVGYCYVDGGSLPAPSNMGVLDFMQVSMNVIARGYD